jgi:hypothetical protein
MIEAVNDPPVTMDQTAYTSEVQPCAGGAAKSVDREKRTGQWRTSLESTNNIEILLEISTH